MALFGEGKSVFLFSRQFLPNESLKMVKLKICENYLTVVSHQEFLVFLLDKERNAWTFLKVIQCSDRTSKSNDASIECCAFSPCENYFGVCFDRNIIIFSTLNWNILYNSVAERKASSLKFFPKSKKVLLADKSGCTAFYSFQENKLEKSDIALGHNSMLTSALITEDERFVITSDRDEKIRVTNYPNVYNIERYCLGHKMFVSCIQFLPSDKRILISCSGDGTIRLWDFMSGKELGLFNCNDSNDSKITLTKIVTSKQNDVTVVAALEYKSKLIRILNVEGDCFKGFKIKYRQVLELDSIPWDIAFHDNILICLLPNKQNPFTFWSTTSGSETEIQKYFINITQYFTGNWDSFINMSHKICDDIPVLFKREVDNLQEYEQRKKARLLRTGKTS